MKRLQLAFLFFVLGLLLTISFTSVTAQDDVIGLAEGETARVIVEFESASPQAVPRNAQELAEVRTAVNLTQRIALRALLTEDGIELLRTFPYSPTVVLEVDAAGLQRLTESDFVVSIEEDTPEWPALTESIPMIGADVVHADGWTGWGYAVAILDTGIDGSHSDFLDSFGNSRIIHEACFTTNYAPHGAQARCPGGTEQAFGPGAAADCDASTGAGCEHGTHVSGIAAGVDGVAPEAKLIVINIFSLFTLDSECDGNAPCVKTYPSDQILALEHIYYSNLSMSPQYPVAAINMSIQGKRHEQPCTTDDRAGIINNLLLYRGIPTVISSGNQGYRNAVAEPSCIPASWAVAASYDTSPADAPELASLSNISELVDFIAPGDLITATRYGGGEVDKRGTSMAAPHVTGAAAVLRQLHRLALPGRSAYQATTEIYNALYQSGIPVSDDRPEDINHPPGLGTTRPHINLANAAEFLLPASLNCGNRRATIYVQDGIIIGGLDHGRPYEGVLRGTSRRDVVMGTDGPDTIYTYATDDYVCAGAGDDVIYTAEGQDDIWAGDGNDQIFAGVSGDEVWGEGGDDVIFLSEGSDYASGGDGDDTFFGGTGQDYMEGGAGNDYFEGSDGDDHIYGGDGNDSIHGHGGNDRLYGEGDDDQIFGHHGDDHIYGGDGTDDLRGQDNNDWLYGEAGDGDVLFGGEGDDRLSGGDGVDDRCVGEGGPHDYTDDTCEIREAEH